MLLTINQLRPYEPRAICYAAQQFIDARLSNPLDTDIEPLELLRDYHAALIALPSRSTEMNDLIDALLRAVENEAAHDEMIEREEIYIHNLNEAYARYSENPLR